MARDLNDTFILPSGTERLRNLCCYFFIGLDEEGTKMDKQ